MKNFTKAVSYGICFFGLSISSTQPSFATSVGSTPPADESRIPEFEIITVVPERVTVPTHVREKEPTRVEISGMFQNSCYHIRPSHVEVDHGYRTILIHTEASYFSSSWCLFMMVPFVQEVPIGTLEVGNYQLFFQDENGRPEHTGVSLWVQADG